jgi:hypothetical protein
MLSQRSNNGHHLHFTGDKKSSQPPEKSIYLAIAVIGGLICITRPILLLLAGALIAYGRLQHESKHQNRQNRFGVHPDNNHDSRHDSLADLGNVLGLKDDRGRHGVRRFLK